MPTNYKLSFLEKRSVLIIYIGDLASVATKKIEKIQTRGNRRFLLSISILIKCRECCYQSDTWWSESVDTLISVNENILLSAFIIDTLFPMLGIDFAALQSGNDE